jgi:hypothetical protein
MGGEKHGSNGQQQEKSPRNERNSQCHKEKEED